VEWNSTRPELVAAASRFPPGLHTTRPYGSASQGVYVYPALNERGVRVVDIHDPYHPVDLGRGSSPGFAREVAALGDYVYVSATDRLWIFQVRPEASSGTTSPASPRRRARRVPSGERWSPRSRPERVRQPSGGLAPHWTTARCNEHNGGRPGALGLSTLGTPG
jgi:hypothetical protein